MVCKKSVSPNNNINHPDNYMVPLPLPSFFIFFFLGIRFKGFFGGFVFLFFLTGLVLRNGELGFYTFSFPVLGSLLHES